VVDDGVKIRDSLMYMSGTGYRRVMDEVLDVGLCACCGPCAGPCVTSYKGRHRPWGDFLSVPIVPFTSHKFSTDILKKEMGFLGVSIYKRDDFSRGLIYEMCP
jgi:hypothetical protein